MTRCLMAFVGTSTLPRSRIFRLGSIPSCKHIGKLSNVCDRNVSPTSSFGRICRLVKVGVSSQLLFWFVLTCCLFSASIAWLIYVVGSVISGHITTMSSRDDQITIDGQLSARVFLILDTVTTRVASSVAVGAPVTPYIDLAIIYFFQQFRKYVVLRRECSTRLTLLLGLTLARRQYPAVSESWILFHLRRSLRYTKQCLNQLDRQQIRHLS